MLQLELEAQHLQHGCCAEQGQQLQEGCLAGKALVGVVDQIAGSVGIQAEGADQLLHLEAIHSPC